VESSGREANGGWESQQGSKFQNPQSIGMWGQFSSQGSGEGRTRRPREQPWPEHPVNLSRVSSTDVRYCRIKTIPRVERKDLLRSRLHGCAPSPPGSGSSHLGELGSGLSRRGQAMGEGESLWSLIICDH
jgi:hypothetical protein